MRLLHTTTLKLAEFFDEQLPPYAILSHTWDSGEVTHRDIQNLEEAGTMQGFPKIQGACGLAAAEGYEFIWIDTCCIDKSSSAELSEAINSMYAWYRRSAVCYVFLADMAYSGDVGWENPAGNANANVVQFRACRWFTRGWTLQELIAPGQVVFYSRDWQNIGTKMSLRRLISEITGIDISILAGGDHQSVCVARKMFWASRRNTTRTEDMAYCLMGIFAVNMPLIYGEGKNAFARLQDEIIRTHDDQSIFAWTMPKELASPHRLYGLLADSPSSFANTGRAVAPFRRKHPHRQTTRVTNNGLETELLLQPQRFTLGTIEDSKLRHMPTNFYRSYHLGVLDCQFGSSGDSWPCIDVVALGSDEGGTEYQQFARINPWEVAEQYLTKSVTSSRFQNGLGDDDGSGSWPIPLIVSEWATQLQAFWYSSTAWDFQKISVSNKPQQILPFGYGLQISDKRVRAIEGHPASQWFNHDQMFQRPHLSKGDTKGKTGPLSVKTRFVEDDDTDDEEEEGAATHGTQEITSVADGVVRLEVRPYAQWSDFIAQEGYQWLKPAEEGAASGDSWAPDDDLLGGDELVQSVGLVLGVDFIFLPSRRDWIRDPWCRIVELEQGGQMEGFEYEISDEEDDECTFQTMFDTTLTAKVSKLDSNGLYKVQLGLKSTPFAERRPIIVFPEIEHRPLTPE